MEGITVDGGGGLRVGAGEEKVRDGVLGAPVDLCRHMLAFHGFGSNFSRNCFGIYSPCRSSSDSG